MVEKLSSFSKLGNVFILGKSRCFNTMENILAIKSIQGAWLLEQDPESDFRSK